jgi:NTP pyrophosphatase (non-canonical NTP hydrolase)
VQTCLVWIRFSSSRHERLPDSGEPFFYWDGEAHLAQPKPSPALAPGASVDQTQDKVVTVMDIKELTDRMHDLVRSKGWYAEDSKRPQTPRNLAISLSVEAAEILEHFQFHENAEDKEELAGELADVALYLLQLASITEIDLEKAILDKIEINKTREWDQE